MTRTPQIDTAAVAELEANAFLRAQFDARDAMIFRQWCMAETLNERERLHAEHKALTNFKKALYGECKRITSGG